MKIAPGTSSDLCIVGPSASTTRQLLCDNEPILRSLVRLGKISVIEAAPHDLELASRSPMNDVELIVPLPTEMREQEIARLQKAIEKGRVSSEKAKAQFDKLLCSGKAPQEVLEKLRLSLEQQVRDGELLRHRLETLLKR